VTLNVALLTLVAGVAAILDPSAKFWTWWALACAGMLTLHVLRGWQLSGMGLRGLTALAHVPGFILWRVWLLMGRKPSEWVRTEREKSP
jgi:hypothetical protein